MNAVIYARFSSDRQREESIEVQARMEKNKQAPAATKVKDNYTLTTKLFCGDCGKIMFGEWGTGTGGKREPLEQQILRERIKNPALTREQISFFLEQYKKTDVNDENQRQRLIDSFVNAVYVYDDKIILVFNYKEGTETVSLSDIKSSDLDELRPPKESLELQGFRDFSFCFFYANTGLHLYILGANSGHCGQYRGHSKSPPQHRIRGPPVRNRGPPSSMTHPAERKKG